VEEIGYGREITDNVRGFVTVRISSLRLGTTGRFLQGGHPVDFARLLERNVVFEIEVRRSPPSPPLASGPRRQGSRASGGDVRRAVGRDPRVRIPVRPSGKRPTRAPFLARPAPVSSSWSSAGMKPPSGDQQKVRAVVYGTRPASAVERAIGARTGDQDWEQQLADALTAFRECQWVLDYLRPAVSGT